MNFNFILFDKYFYFRYRPLQHFIFILPHSFYFILFFYFNERGPPGATVRQGALQEEVTQPNKVKLCIIMSYSVLNFNYRQSCVKVIL